MTLDASVPLLASKPIEIVFVERLLPLGTVVSPLLIPFLLPCPSTWIKSFLFQ
jgi:hypothetical protein